MNKQLKASQSRLMKKSKSKLIKKSEVFDDNSNEEEGKESTVILRKPFQRRGSLGETVGNLIQSHRTVSERMHALRGIRSKLRKAFQERMDETEHHYEEKLAESRRELEHLKESLAEERARANALSSLNETGSQKLQELTQETAFLYQTAEELQEEVSSAESAKEQLNKDVQAVRSELKNQLQLLEQTDKAFKEAKEARKRKESQLEALKSSVETIEERERELTKKVDEIIKDRREKDSLVSQKFAETHRQLQDRFGSKRLEQERVSLEEGYAEKLGKLLQKVAAFNADQLADYATKSQQVFFSTENVKSKTSELLGEKRLLQKELSRLEAEQNALLAEIETKQQSLKELIFLKKENRTESEAIFHRLREHMRYYLELVQRRKGLVEEKISVLQNLEEAKTALATANKSAEGSINDTEVDEQDSLNLEDKLLSATVFPDLCVEEGNRELEIEAFLTANVTVVRNTGTETVQLPPGLIRLKLKRNKSELRVSDKLVLESGSSFVALRKGAFLTAQENLELRSAVAVLEWDLTDLSDTDEVVLFTKNKIVDRALIVGDELLDSIGKVDSPLENVGSERKVDATCKIC